MMRGNRKQSGFTLIEVIISLGLASVVVAMLMFAVTGSMRAMQSLRRAERAHANANAVVDVVVYWVKQAETIEAPDADTLVIRLPDDTEKTIELDSGSVKLDSVPLTSSDVTVSSLAFTALPRSVQYAFTITAGGPESVSITSTVAQRNDPS